MAASLCVTVLAAGKGTRMRNALPKVLHPLAGRTLLEHVLASAAELAPDSHRARAGRRTWTRSRRVAGRSPLAPTIVVQDPQLGTGHALIVPRARICRREGTVLVLFGDTPLLTGDDAAARCSAARDDRRCRRGRARHAAGRSGRLRAAAARGRRLVEIVEDRHADPS